MTKVLVVEDETSYSEALSYVLRKEGFDVAIAETGPDALTEFDRGGADIVLLDLMLPGLSGTEVCRALRQISSVPIIMVSAKDTEVDAILCALDGRYIRPALGVVFDDGLADVVTGRGSQEIKAAGDAASGHVGLHVVG